MKTKDHHAGRGIPLTVWLHSKNLTGEVLRV
jgi:hypothetical protein